MHLDHLSEAEIARRLAQPGSPEWSADQRYGGFFAQPSRPAAVLVPFLQPHGPGSPWHILLTRRTDLVADHKGQVAYPGGRAHPDDPSPQLTALREADEEIGLQPQDVRVLGELEALHTISNYRVTPVVGMIPWPYNLRLQTTEVGRVFTIPLEWLVDPAHFELRERQVNFPACPETQRLRVIYYQPYDGEVLWGVSAEITLRLLARLNLLDIEPYDPKS
jgi:8-oxo-dGTP pyrophosphatase MutT (NUDIX family)